MTSTLSPTLPLTLPSQLAWLTAGLTCKPVSFTDPERNPETTKQIRQGIAESLNLGHLPWCVPQQVHEAVVVTATPDWPAPAPEADTVLLTQPHVVGVVQTADCTPILLADPINRHAVLIHAGWRGTAQQIVFKAATALHAAGKQPSNPHVWVAVIGPSISQHQYEVDAPVYEALTDSLSGITHETIPPWALPSRDGHWFVDVAAVNARQLQSLGVKTILASDGSPWQPNTPQWCTRLNNAQWWSHRAGETGRLALWAVIQHEQGHHPAR